MKQKDRTGGPRIRLAELTLAGALLLAACEGATSGARIGSYARPQIALLVVDAQKDFLDASGKLAAPAEQVTAALERMNQAIDGARPGGVQIVYVRSEFPASWIGDWRRAGAAHAKDPGADLDPRIHQVGRTWVVKPQGDAFSSPELPGLLADSMVDHLVLVGADNTNGIRLTAEGARNRGFKVQVVGDGIVSTSDSARARVLSRLREQGVEITDGERAVAEWTRRKRYLAGRD